MGRDHSETCHVCGCQYGGFDDLECACDRAGSAARRAADRRAMDTLAANLREAGALCESWRMGDEFDYERGGWTWLRRQHQWFPGCRRPAHAKQEG